MLIQMQSSFTIHCPNVSCSHLHLYLKIAQEKDVAAWTQVDGVDGE